MKARADNRATPSENGTGMQACEQTFSFSRSECRSKDVGFDLVEGIVIDTVLGAREVIFVIVALGKKREVVIDGAGQFQSEAPPISRLIVVDAMTVRDARQVMKHGQE